MRVLYFQQNPEWGGCEDYLQSLIEGVTREQPDWEVLVLCPAKALERWEKAVGACAEVIPARERLFHMVRQLRKLRIDLLHVNDPAVKALAAARLARIPRVVMTYHTPSLEIRNNWKGRLLWWYGLHNSNAHFIALSHSNQQSLTEKYGFSEQQVHRIPQGLPTGKFEVQVDPSRIRENLGIDQEAFLLICVGRLVQQKAHEVLLDAFARVVGQTSRPLNLLVVGDGEQRPQLEQCAKDLRLERLVHFLGHRDDVPSLLSAADLFVSSSDFEGLPSAIIEAMAMERPVVATAVDGVNDVVTDETGILVGPRDPRALTDAILWFLRHRKEAEQMGRAGKKIFLREYTSETMSQGVLSLYGQLL